MAESVTLDLGGYGVRVATVGRECGVTVLRFGEPFEAVDACTGRPVLVESVVDNTPGGARGSVRDWFYVVGAKQRKDGTFYGRFTTLDVPCGPAYDAIVEFNASV